MSELSKGGVTITPPSQPSDDLPEAPIVGGNPPKQVSFSGGVDAQPKDKPQDTASENAERLKKFLSARTEPETKKLIVESLGTTIVIRELTAREADDVYEMFEGRLGARRSGRSSGKDKSLSEIQAHLVAKAIVEPNFNDPNVLAAFQEKFPGMGLPDILLQLMKPLEITAIFDKIMEISGGNEDAVTEAKN